ncbi:acetylcholinesterase [Rhipicephalus sanguineus]|uniref:acetylcholinesterase n=1 Tax=Rhipicephalus sanguineus TaxID=34632 RepID=UPI0020C34767|nr:acetylcholinesterase [Rhipicephalus sanguineus]
MGATPVAAILLVLTAASHGFHTDVTRNTSLGLVKGNRLVVLGRPVEEYLGIPYAKPPIGGLRFTPPRPAEPWQGTLDARSRKTACPQVFTMPHAFGNIEHTEDCLHLNVWSPQNRTQEAAPVLAWIHGGGFMQGSSGQSLYNGAVLAARTGLVIVGLNYRLGILGFLDANTTQAPGNVGLMDQNMALKWIRDHIGRFGGDPLKVTIFGESSGAMSAHAHVISPVSRGLFLRACLMSGTLQGQGFYQTVNESMSKGNTIAVALGCSDNETNMFTDPDTVVACLRSKNPFELARLASTIFKPKIFPFLPTFPNKFFPVEPRRAVKQGSFNAADLFVGVTSDEGAIALMFPISNEIIPREFHGGLTGTQFESSVRERVFAWLKADFARPLDAYIPKKNDSQSLRRGYVDYLTDSLFVCPMHLTAEEISSKEHSVYTYVFGHRSKKSTLPPWMGTPHGWDVSYTFGMPLVNQERFNAQDMNVSEVVITAVSTFASTGTEDPGKMGGSVTPILLLFITASCGFASDVVKNTRLGWIKGNRLEILGRAVDEFRGIPYAQPPLDALRFRPPRPYGPWNGTLDARSKRTACPQVVSNPKAFASVQLTEDCLQLNIWSPQERAGGTVPVLVWIHGGGFTHGSSAQDVCNGVVLAARTGLVVASFNYRLGFLGFLDAQFPEAPGNVGLLDQNLALNWIRGNIDQYGGDPSRVTIFGDSAGGMSVHGHVISPLSNGLFARACLMSGTLHGRDFIEPSSDSISKGDLVAKAVDCADSERNLTTDPEYVLECLRSKNASELVRVTNTVLSPKFFPFLPTFPNDFLPMDPSAAVKQGLFNAADLMAGVTSDEGATALRSLPNNLDHFDRKRLEQTLHFLIFPWLKTNFSKPLDVYKAEAFDNELLRRAYTDYLSDSVFFCPMHFTAAEHSNRNQSVFTYVFGHQSRKNPLPSWMGTPHSYDVNYMLGRPLVDQRNYTAEDARVSELDITALSTFASTGVPKLPGDQPWPKYTSDNKVSVYISGNNVTDIRDFHMEKCEVWKKFWKM